MDINRRVLVVGATGGLGRLIVKKLLRQNIFTRILVRDLSNARKLFGNEIDMMRGDTRLPETLMPALEDINIVICSTGTRLPIGGNSPKDVDFKGVSNLVEAAKTTAVERFLLVSSIAVTKPEHPLNKFGKVLDWKLKGENVLRQSGLTYTIIRPGGLTNEPGAQNGLFLDQGDRISGMISRADVAETCYQAMDHQKTQNITFEVISAQGDPINDWDSLFEKLSPDLV